MITLPAVTATFLGFEHPVGGTISILGAFLLGIGIVGKRRLERWDEAVAEFTESTANIEDGARQLSRLILIIIAWLFERCQPVAEEAPGCYYGIVGVVFLAILISGFLLFIGGAFTGNTDNNWAVTLGLWIFMAGGWLLQITLWIIGLALVIEGLLLLIGFVIVPLAVRIPSMLVWVCTSPYLLMRWVDKEGVLDRTFLLIGTVLTVVGIAMCLFTGNAS